MLLLWWGSSQHVPSSGLLISESEAWHVSLKQQLAFAYENRHPRINYHDEVQEGAWRFDRLQCRGILSNRIFRVHERGGRLSCRSGVYKIPNVLSHVDASGNDGTHRHSVNESYLGNRHTPPELFRLYNSSRSSQSSWRHNQ